MYFDKRYLQFNDLVFDGYDMISDFDEPVQYKGSSTPISYGHGSYRAFKSDFLYVSERQANMTITLHLRKIPCGYRKYYARFVEQELGKPGRLWAIKNDEIIWAFAAANNIRPVHTGKKYELVYDVEFVIPSGVWNKADKLKTFVFPYDVCTVMELGGCCCEDDVTMDMTLLRHKDELQLFYGCDTPYQLMYNCELAEKLCFGKTLGRRMCADIVNGNGVIAGQLYSETDIPTPDITITIVGTTKNPWITINGNTNIIEGEYSGRLTINANGDIYYQESECCEPTLLSPLLDDGATPRWTIPQGNTYGWTIYPQMNDVIIHLNACDTSNGVTCAYIDHTALTL